MAEEYYSDYKRREKPHHRLLATSLLDGCMTVLTIFTGMAMALTLLVPYIHPAKVTFFPMLGLIAPGVFMATVVLALYWIIRWRWGRASVLLVLIAVGCFHTSLFYRGQFRRTYGEPDYDRTFKVMTYNVRYFYDDRGETSPDRISRLILRHDPDIVCLQEYNAAVVRQSTAFTNLLKNYSVVGTSGTSAAGPMVILSKFPIVQSDTIPAFGASMWADVRIGNDVVRIFNNHLHTTEIKADDDEFITRRLYLTDSTRWAKIRSIIRRHRNNSVLRAEQVDRIAPVIAATRTRYIVCGDFNDTPVSYVYRTMARGTKDAFSECGTGYSHTYRGFFNTLRIDYLLHSTGLEAVSYATPFATYSDHRPVVVRLQKTSEP